MLTDSAASVCFLLFFLLPPNPLFPFMWYTFFALYFCLLFLHLSRHPLRLNLMAANSIQFSPSARPCSRLCQRLTYASCHPLLWPHFPVFLSFHPNSILFPPSATFISSRYTFIPSSTHFLLCQSPHCTLQTALRATCNPSFPDLEKITDPTDAIFSLSCILFLLFPSMESRQPQSDTWKRQPEFLLLTVTLESI